MRHVFAVAGVIVVAMGLGGYVSSLSVDFKLPALEWLRPQAATAATERAEREEKQRTIQVAASGCKYCADIADLAKTFTRRAEIARTHAGALQTALDQGAVDEVQLAARREDELNAAKVAASRAEAAASILTGWASKCTAQDFCKLPVTRVAQSCASQDDQRSAAALLIAMSVRTAAQQCATSECPSVDCKSSAALGADINRVAAELDEIGGNVSNAPVRSLSELPVGASTLKGEITRIADETKYVANMLPLLLDVTKRQAAMNLPRLAPELADQRAVSAAELATVMEQAAAVGEIKNDPRTEAAWRLKSLATHLAALGKDTSASAIDWRRAADALGAGLMDLARLQALVDRQTVKVSEACDGSVGSVAQQLREARAMLDHCRMRAACVSRGGAGTVTKVSSGDIDEVISRATVSAQGLVVNEIGSGDGLIAAADGAEPALIDVLRTHGVCRRAGELREASVAAPKASAAVAQAAVAPALSPATGAVSPQDLVMGAVQSALNAAPTDTTAAPAEVVQAAAPVRPVAKPRRPDAELMPAVAPAPAVPELSDFGNGTGGPAMFGETPKQ
jgi:hypothetical protein